MRLVSTSSSHSFYLCCMIAFFTRLDISFPYSLAFVKKVHHLKITRMIHSFNQLDQSFEKGNQPRQLIFPDNESEDEDIYSDDPSAINSIDKKKKVKIRQHSNPLTMTNQKPLHFEENWIEKYFTNPRNPFIIDVGCAKGGWVLNFAYQNPQYNVLGLELRESAVAICNRRKERYPIGNVHFFKSNANVDLANLLQSLRQYQQQQALPFPLLDFITIQFPDPHFKKKHQKRRVVNQQLVEVLAQNTDLNHTKIFLQTDIEELALDMISHFQSSPYFTADSSEYAETTLTLNPNPFSIPTEREIACLKKVPSLPIYRMLYNRNHLPV